MTWWSQELYDELCSSLTGSEMDIVRKLSCQQVSSLLRHFAKSFVDFSSIAETRTASIVKSEISSLRQSLQTDIANSLSPLSSGLVSAVVGVTELRGKITQIDGMTSTLLEKTDRMPVTIEEHRLKSKTPAAVQGERGEDYVLEALQRKFGDVVRTNRKTASGDIRVNSQLLVEVKNYTSGKDIGPGQFEKFIRDIATCKEVTCGLFICLGSGLSGSSFRTPIDISVRAFECDRKIPIGVVTSDQVEIIQAVAEILLTQAKVNDSVSVIGTVNAGIRDEIHQMIGELIKNLSGIVLAKENLMELSSQITVSLQKSTFTLAQLEQSFYTKLVAVRQRLDGICSEETVRTVYYPVDESIIDTELLKSCVFGKHLVSKIILETLRRLAICAAPQPPKSVFRVSSRYIDSQYYSIRFLKSSSIFSVPSKSLTHQQICEWMERFSHHDYTITGNSCEILVTEESTPIILHHGLRISGLP